MKLKINLQSMFQPSMPGIPAPKTRIRRGISSKTNGWRRVKGHITAWMRALPNGAQIFARGVHH